MIYSASHPKKIKKKNKRCGMIKRLHRDDPMTVCIAAIAEIGTEYPKIIIAADREVTTDWISYTSGVGKIRVITDYCWSMISTNNALVCNDIITKSIQTIGEILKNEPNKKLSIEEISILISNEFRWRLDFERERFILSPHGLTYDSYLKRSSELSREHTEIITRDLAEFEYENYNFRAEILVFGIDTRPHIFTIVQNGQFVSSDSEGFAIAGGGKSTAFPEFTKYPYSPNSHWLYALHRVYTSKKVAERVGGVGSDTDLIVLHLSEKGNMAYWGADIKTQMLLDSGIKAVQESEIKIYNDLLEQFNNLLISETKK